MNEKLGWTLFIADLLLLVGGGIVEKFSRPIGTCMLISGVVILIVMWRLDRR